MLVDVLLNGTFEATFEPPFDETFVIALVPPIDEKFDGITGDV